MNGSANERGAMTLGSQADGFIGAVGNFERIVSFCGLHANGITKGEAW